MTKYYTSSKGEKKVIADLPTPHLSNALAKLERDDPGRADEIKAMRGELDRRDTAEQYDRIHLGANNPPADPEPVPAIATVDPAARFEAVKINIDDLYDEAKNWLDGAEIENQEQADALGLLMDSMRKAAKAADDARKIEAKPFDDGKAAVQARYKPILEKADRAVTLSKTVLGKWLRALDDERKRQAEAARKEAEEAARAAQEAIRAAQASEDLAKREAAEQAAKAAKQAQSAATKLETARPQVQGMTRAASLRTYYTAEVTDFYAALEHFLAEQPDAFVPLLTKLAQTEVDSGKRQIPGVTVHAEQKVA